MRKRGSGKKREKTLKEFQEKGLPTKELEKDLKEYRTQEEAYLKASQ
jgi:hypothetical protein